MFFNPLHDISDISDGLQYLSRWMGGGVGGAGGGGGGGGGINLFLLLHHPDIDVPVLGFCVLGKNSSGRRT